MTGAGDLPAELSGHVSAVAGRDAAVPGSSTVAWRPHSSRVRLSRALGHRCPQLVADALAQGGLILAGWGKLAVPERTNPFRSDWNLDRGDTPTDVAHAILTSGLAQLANATFASLLGPKRPRRGISPVSAG